MTKSHVIVIGNEKGGVGKTTTSVHLIISLLHLGFKVSSIDADCRQQSLSRYLVNRASYAQKHITNPNISKIYHPRHFALSAPLNILLDNKEEQIVASNIDDHIRDNISNNIVHNLHYDLHQNYIDNNNQTQNEELIDKLKQVIAQETNSETVCDFLIIDTPGSKTSLSKYAHSLANTIITPINDSFVDLDVIAKIEEDSFKMIKPSFYAQEIKEHRDKKAKDSKDKINWIVVRNRLSTIDAKNKQRISKALENIGAELDFKIADGFSERVIYRELFLYGLTLLDIKSGVKEISLSMSHIAAKQELNNFLKQIGINELTNALAELK